MTQKSKKSLKEKLPYSDLMLELIEQLADLPGIGEKSAEKLAYHILMLPQSEAMKLANAISKVKEKMTVCRTCYNMTEENPCAICKDESRDGTKICVVEQPKDMWAIEKTGKYHGKYHILTGKLSPLEGITADNLTIRPLIDRIKLSYKEPPAAQRAFVPLNKGDRANAKGVQEVIIATNPDFEGDGTMLAVVEALKNYKVKITRIARGIPLGGSIEFASPGMLGEAFENRQNV